MTEAYQTLRIERGDQGVVTVTLARGETRNAFDARLIDELRRAFEALAGDADLRAVILRGEGKAFCAGADLNWMRASAALSEAENEAGAREMAAMFAAVASCPVPVIAVVHGHALGGGAGLVAAADVALGTAGARFGFTEVLLGIIPAVISPYVLRKLSQTQARRYFVTGEIFDGREAERIGLLQKCLADEASLEAEVAAMVTALMRAGPAASREAKKLVAAVAGLEPERATDLTAPWIARIRGSTEGQEGMAAFLGKRRAAWVPEESA
ncbi:MAG: enoyl-CoA hydratase/isomerase family protein [Planctomycetes bacterium]|nr:enoyl-CoA hydratase/isomerase family protein [Planctomycetota bacterium]